MPQSSSTHTYTRARDITTWAWAYTREKQNRLLQFIGRLRRPVVSNLASADDAVAFKTRDETVFIAYLNSADGAEAKAFAGVAEKYREEFSFGVVVDPAVAAAEKAKSPSVVCYKVADADTVHLASFDEPEKLEGWAKEAARPVIGELTSQNQQRLLDVGTSLLPGVFSFLFYTLFSFSSPGLEKRNLTFS